MARSTIPTPVQHWLQVTLDLIRHESAGGVILVAMAALALIVANSPIAPLYKSFFSTAFEIRFGDFKLEKPLLLWINDGLMAIFFFSVGLEIKREFLVGQLSSPDQIILPALAAAAGVILPALIYAFFNHNDPVALKGWAIPSATDIAFALGVFTLFGNRVPLSLKLFLLSVAIFDDLAAILIIAFFYATKPAVLSLVFAGLGLGGLFLLNRFRVQTQAIYLVVSVFVWVAVLKSGVHATIAGFVCALFIPLKVTNQYGQRMLSHLEEALSPWVGYAILPLFAFGNAGISLQNVTLQSIMEPVSVGALLGLFLGKQIGIFGTCLVAIKAGLARMPQNATWLQLYAVSVLCGIGFTMSLFVSALAFEQEGLGYQVDVKLAVMLGSLLSAIVGSILISLSQPKRQTSESSSEQSPA